MMESPKAIFYCGVNGSGKSTLREYQEDGVEVVIDSDNIAKRYKSVNPSNDLSNLLAGKEAIKLFKQCIAQRIPFSMETTLSGLSCQNRIKASKHAGFRVIIKYIGLEKSSLNVLRVKQRAKSGGHDIAENIILRRSNEIADNFFDVVKFADEVFVYDNSKMQIKLQFIISDNLIISLPKCVKWAGDYIDRFTNFGYEQSHYNL